MSLDKSGLQSAFLSIFTDVDPSKTASQKAASMADAVDEYVKTALVNCTIPSGTVIVQVTGGSGAPAVGIPNASPISLSGDPDVGTGGLS